MDWLDRLEESCPEPDKLFENGMSVDDILPVNVKYASGIRAM
jgi:hypothetical protein